VRRASSGIAFAIIIRVNNALSMRLTGHFAPFFLAKMAATGVPFCPLAFLYRGQNALIQNDFTPLQG